MHLILLGNTNQIGSQTLSRALDGSPLTTEPLDPKILHELLYLPLYSLLTPLPSHTAYLYPPKHQVFLPQGFCTCSFLLLYLPGVSLGRYHCLQKAFLELFLSTSTAHPQCSPHLPLVVWWFPAYLSVFPQDCLGQGLGCLFCGGAPVPSIVSSI